MASCGSYLLEIDEKFCQCPFCLEQYKEPKLLPCLHRYCSDCLRQLIEKNQSVKTMSCPECRHDFEIPDGGATSFKTDFYMKNIIEYIELQKSLEDDQMRHCCDSSNRVKVVAYCFKCKDFLCTECYNIHLTKKMLKDHKQHTFSLEDAKPKTLSFEKLSLLKEVPRCQSHPEDLCRLCCTTCNNLPICVNCTYGSHEGHTIKEVSMLATQDRETLRVALKTLGESKERIYELAEKVKRVREELIADVEAKKDIINRRQQWNIKKVNTEIKNMEDYNKKKEEEIEKMKEKDLMEKRKEMENEIREIKKKYDDVCDEIVKDSKLKLTDLQQQRNKDLENSKHKLSNLESDLKKFITAIEKRLEESMKILNEMSQQLDSTKKRFENVTTTATFVLEATNDWTTVECFPDIRAAVEPLQTDMKMEFPELKKKSSVVINSEIKENQNSPCSIKGHEVDSWYTDGITGSDEGNIIITGLDCTFGNHRLFHITVGGDVLSENTLELSGYDCRCTHLSQYKVLITSEIDDIGIYNVSDESHINMKISDVVSSWPKGHRIACVAADLANNRIFIKNESSDVYVLDNDLRFLHTITFPGIIDNVNDMSVTEDNLIVCSNSKNAAYVLTMHMSECKLLCKLPKPHLLENYLTPISVCTDRSGYIYLLWEGEVGDTIDVCLAQYSPFNYELIFEKMICYNARFIATVGINQAEMLLITTRKSKYFIYELGGLHVL